MFRVRERALTALVAVGVAVGAWSVAARPAASVAVESGALGSARATTNQGESAVQLLAAKIPHSSLTYVPVKPCRLLNTVGSIGALPTNVTKTIRVKGSSGFPAQGGRSGGCGIPEVAAAADLVFRSSGSSANGYLRSWAPPASEPPYAVLTFHKGQATSSTSTVEIAGSTSTGNLKVRSRNASTQLTIAVVGYYIAPIAAAVAGDGTLISATNQVATVAHPSTGSYRILSKTIPLNCAVLTTPLWGNVTVTARFSTTGFVPVVEVLTRNNATGKLGNYPFYVQVVC